MYSPINVSGERQGYTAPADSPTERGKWYAYRLEDGAWRYAGVYDNQEDAERAAGLRP